MTTEEELRQWLENTDVVNRSTLADFHRLMPSGLEMHVYGWRADAAGPGVGIEVISGTVSTVDLWLGYPLTLGDVVDQMGPPEYMQAEQTSSPEECLYGIDFYYPQRGMALYVMMLNCDSAERDPGTGQLIVPLEQGIRISYIICSQPGPIDDVLQEYGYWTQAEAVEHADRLREWPGFGMILLWDLWPGPYGP